MEELEEANDEQGMNEEEGTNLNKDRYLLNCISLS